LLRTPQPEERLKPALALLTCPPGFLKVNTLAMRCRKLLTFDLWSLDGRSKTSSFKIVDSSSASSVDIYTQVIRMKAMVTVHGSIHQKY